MKFKISEVKVNTINGSELDWSKFENKKLMIVNVASQCGFTPQYKHLEELYEHFKDRLIVLGCPCNDFGAQEPGSHEQIASFCETNYGVTFPLTEKLQISENPHRLYQWLTLKENNGVADNEVKWNFHKFLINEDLSLYKSLSSEVSPLSEEIMNWLEDL